MNLPKRKQRPRMNVQPPTRVECPGHCKWVRSSFGCAIAGKVCKSTGIAHECEGRIDPHHTPTRGAGGGDDRVVPLCRKAHDLIETPNWSEARVQSEYGVPFAPMAADLWKADAYHRGKYEMSMMEMWGFKYPEGAHP